MLMLGLFAGWGMAALTLSDDPKIVLPIMARESEVLDSSHPVSNLPLKFEYLLIEHGEQIADFSRAKYDGADLQKPSSALEANTNSLADLASKLFGEKGRGIFLQMWKEHNLEIMNYTQAVKVGDPIMQQNAKQNLERITTQMRETIKSSNPDYPVDELSGLINEHLKLTLQLIDMYPQKNATVPQTEEKMQAISTQAGRISQFIITNL